MQPFAGGRFDRFIQRMLDYPLTKLNRLTGKDNFFFAHIFLIIGWIVIQASQTWYYQYKDHSLFEIFLMLVWLLIYAHHRWIVNIFRDWIQDSGGTSEGTTSIPVQIARKLQIVIKDRQWYIGVGIFFLPINFAGYTDKHDASIFMFGAGLVIYATGLHFMTLCHPPGKSVLARAMDKIKAIEIRLPTLVPAPTPVLVPIRIR